MAIHCDGPSEGPKWQYNSRAKVVSADFCSALSPYIGRRGRIEGIAPCDDYVGTVTNSVLLKVRLDLRYGEDESTVVFATYSHCFELLSPLDLLSEL